MTATLKTPHYRIDDPLTGLAVQFVSEPSARDQAPRIFARLTQTAGATVFMTRELACECFEKFCHGAPLDIVRVDA